MSMRNRKKVRAAIAGAVSLYMQACEEEALLAAREERTREAPGPSFSPWVSAGRQSMMDMRQLLQMRLVR